MYKVFSNAKLILPGLEIPPGISTDGIRLNGIPSAHEFRQLILALRRSSILSWLQYGMHEGKEKAWEAFRQSLQLESAAGGFVIGGQENLLLIRRHGMWDLPKGKPNPGERIPDTALREVREETGLSRIKLLGFLGMSHHIFERNDILHLKENHWYLMESDDLYRLEPQIEEGITQAIWVSLETFNSLKSGLYPSLLDIAEKGWEAVKKKL